MKKAKHFFGLLVMVLLAATAKSQCPQGSPDYNDSSCTYVDGWTNNMVEWTKADQEKRIFYKNIFIDALKSSPNSLLFADATTGKLGNYSISSLSLSSTQITGLTSTFLNGIYGYTPYNGTTNPNGFLTVAATSFAGRTGTVVPQATDYSSFYKSASYTPSNSEVITALGLTPVNQAGARSAISLTTTGTGGPATYNSSTGVLNVPVFSGPVTNSGNTVETVGTGTAYSLTATAAKVDFTGAGSSDPVITIPETGTYLIFTNIKIDFLGLTTVLQTANFKLRRTNNTAADLTGATTNVNIGSATLLTATGPDSDMKVVKYTGTAGDVIELWGNRQNGISIVGNINVSEASVLAVRIY